MKKFTTFLLTLILCISAVFCQTPVITMTTTRAVGSSISFSLTSNTNTTVQVDFGNGTLVNKAITPTGDFITGTLIGANTVKIYGLGITNLGLPQSYGFTTLDASKCTSLTVLTCSFNELTTLNISGNSLLTYLDCTNNKLTTLNLSTNTALTELHCGVNQITSLDISKNVALTKLECFVNQISTLDVSLNTALTKLDCGSNQISNLSLNTKLTDFYCSHNQLTSLDVSKNTALLGFYCNHNQLTSLDLSKNIALHNVFCNDNQLTSLDLSNSNALTDLWCQNNQLTALNVSNTALTTLKCENNKLTFSTLPIKQTSWTTYTYAPQQPIAIAKSLNRGEQIDLSDQLTINGNATVYNITTKSGGTLVKNTDYIFSNGVYVFQRGITDSVYCTMTNAAFPLLAGADVLKTTFTKVSSTTALENTEEQMVEIYNQYLTLFINTPYNAQLSIFDLSGRLVMCKPINSGINSISLQTPGGYLVKLTGNKSLVVKKIMIEK